MYIYSRIKVLIPMSISITLFCARQHIRNLVSPLSFFIMHPSTCQRLHPFMCVCSSTPPSIYPVTLLFPRTSNSIYLSNIYSSVHQLTFDPTTFISTLYSPSSFTLVHSPIHGRTKNKATDDFVLHLKRFSCRVLDHLLNSTLGLGVC